MIVVDEVQPWIRQVLGGEELQFQALDVPFLPTQFFAARHGFRQAHVPNWDELGGDRFIRRTNHLAVVHGQTHDATHLNFGVVQILQRVIGVVVDSVSDVISLAPEAIKPAPDFGAALDTEYILGLAAVDDRMLIHIDIEKLMGSRDMALIPDAAGGE